MTATAGKELAARRHYDRWSRAYSRSRLLASLQDRALAQLALRDEDRLLDVACGAGKLVRAVAPRVQRVVGVDLSPVMIEEARRRTRGEEPAVVDRIDFVVAASDRLPFADAEFTALVTTTAFHHFPDPAASVREMARVLAPGGRIVIGDAVRDLPHAKIGDAVLRRFEDGHVGLQDRKGFERLLADAGIRVTRSRSVLFGIYVLIKGAKGTP
jgi:ubiquinone/menaquinone biosynthesis C-methylase UbiE